MKYRNESEIMLKKAQGSYNSAITDLRAGNIDRAVSSFYYSAFQTVVALMLIRGISVSKHTYVRSFVNKELRVPGIISNELCILYNKLMDMRSDADYSSTVTFSHEVIIDLAEKVEEFNRTIRGRILTEEAGSP